MPNPTVAQRNDPPWLKLAFGDLGLAEVTGPQHEERVVETFAIVGHKQINDDETAWCAAWAGAKLELAGIRSTRSLRARSYESFGVDALGDRVPRGAVCVWPRGGNAAQGHVNFALDDDGQHITCLGGNQSKKGTTGAVTIARYRKAAIVAARWPSSVPQADVALPRPRPQLEQDPEPNPAPPRRQPDDPGPEPHQPAPPVPWYRRLWLRWFGGSVGSYIGLAGLTDAQIAAVLMAGAILAVALAVTAVLMFIGPSGRAVVRAWIIRQFRQ